MSSGLDNPSGTTDATNRDGADGTGGSGAAAGGSGEGMTLEQRLEAAERKAAEAERKNQQLLAERSNVERERAALREERNRAANGGNTPATPTDAADPYAADIATLEAQLAQFPNDAATKVALRAARREQAEFHQHAAWQMALAEVGGLDESDDVKRKVVAALRSGGFNTVAAAHQFVKAQQATTTAKTVEDRLKQLEEENRRLRQQSQVVDISTGGFGEQPVEGRRKISLAELTRVMNAGGKAADALQAEIDSGTTVVE